MSDILDAFKTIEKDKTKRKYRQGKSLLVWIASISICVIVIGAIMGTIVLGVIRNRQYWSYITDFSNSASYAYEKGSLKVVDGEDSYIILGDAVYIPYNYLQNLKMGRSWNEVPEDCETMSFDFGDGSSLQIWDVAIKNAKRGSKGLYVRYINQEGRIYQFDVDGASISKIRSTLDRIKSQFKINQVTPD